MFVYFFFNDTATTEIYTLSLHDALPISRCRMRGSSCRHGNQRTCATRSEEHTSELQSRRDLVCRLLLEKKKRRSPRLHELRSPRGGPGSTKASTRRNRKLLNWRPVQARSSTTTTRFSVVFFFFNDTPTTDFYTLSLHDALPI